MFAWFKRRFSPKETNKTEPPPEPIDADGIKEAWKETIEKGNVLRDPWFEHLAEDVKQAARERAEDNFIEKLNRFIDS